VTESPLLADLNEPQREAVTWGEGPLLIVAGAGSGKTRVITRRIAHLIERGEPGHGILAITFTNRAAGEMRERVVDLVGDGRVTVSTFHSFCARLLRVDGERIGLPRGYSIYDSGDQITLVKDICNELGLDTQAYRPRSLLSAISRLKNDGIPVEEAEGSALSHFDQIVGRVYGRYAEALVAADAVDFDDLLLRTVDLFRDHEDILEKWRGRFRHVLVDEYQDTNLVQYRIARDIAAGHGNLCATGDPDQSIYRWRGARVRNILEFERDFPGAHTVRLEQNYRSTNHILAAASGVIANNAGRLLGSLWSELGDGEKITLMACPDEESEADAVVRMVQDRHEQGTSLADMAIFYRTNALSRGLERALRLHNLPYEIVGAVEFYERKEVKDLLSYLKALSNPADAIAFLRVVNVPARGIGKTSIAKLRAWAMPLGLGPREAAARANEVPGLTARPKKALQAFVALLDELTSAMTERSPEATLQAVIDAVGYEAYLRDFGGQDGIDRVDNVQELVTAVAEYSRAATEASVGGFLEETALVADVDRYQHTGDTLTLMTLHSAKGLEFPDVYLVGMEEGVLPHQRSLETDAEIEEERRLCYVGMTRAMRRLTLSRSGRRMLHGQWSASLPSRFLAELPLEHIEADDRIGAGGGWGGNWGSGGGGDRWSGRDAAAGAAADEAVFVPSPDDYLDVDIPRAGQAVRHAHFGAGVVKEVRGSGPSARIRVHFDRFGEKLLMAEYARLEPA
jgi:DNA helicase-2/ATP-dependent DNA helicase PcrA